MRPASRPAPGQLTSGLRTGSSKRRSTIAEAQIHLQAPTTSTWNRPTSYHRRKHESVPEDEILSLSPRDNDDRKQSTIPAIPAMKRESTSFGVFSNLAAHNKPKRRDDKPTENEVISLNGRGPQSQMLKAVRNGDMKQITKLLESNVDMKFTFSDKDGSSPLHHAMYSGSDDIVKLVLSKRPLVNMFNKAGKTALHIAASRGREQTTHMLLQSGANVNAQNLTSGNTALHDAVTAGHKYLAELLLSYGADVSLTTSDNKTAMDMCNTKCTREDLETATRLYTEGGLEVAEAGSSVSTFKVTGVVLEPRQMTDPMFAVCRRYRASHKTSAALLKDEELTSDEFMIRLGKKDVNYPVFITFPMANGPAYTDEEIVVITGDGQKVLPSEVWQDNEFYMCKFGTTIKQIINFVAVSRQRVEQVLYNKQPTMFMSEVNPKVKVHLGKGCFSKTATVTIKAYELRDNMSLEEGDVLSSTPYYRVDSDDQLAKPVDVELPEPKIYGVEPSHTLVLTKSRSSSNWTIQDHVRSDSTDTEPETNSEQGRSILFSVSSLPSYAVVVRCRQDFNVNLVTTEVGQTLDQILNKTYTVCFLCLAKRNDSEKKCSLVIDCCEVQHADTRRRHWVNKDYLEQQNKSIIDHIEVSSKQSFRVAFRGAAVGKQTETLHTLEFHPKLINKLILDIEMNDSVDFNGRVSVHHDSLKNENKRDNDDGLLTSMDISLVAPVVIHPLQTQGQSENKSDMTYGEKESQSDTDNANDRNNTQNRLSNRTEIQRMGSIESEEYKKSRSSKGDNILTNKFLEQLGDEIEDDWFKIFILMGVSFVDVERVLLKNTPEYTAQQKIFMEWRDSQDNREDIGLPLLLSALCKGGRRDVANTVQIKLKLWHTAVTDEDMPLYQWLCKAYQDSNIFVPSDYPKPMSDAYLVLMADEMVPSRELGLVLSLVNSDIDDIFGCKSYIYPCIKVMKMLILFRESIPNTIDALRKLVECMEMLNYDNLRKYAIMCAKAWVKRTATRKDEPLRTQVDDLMRQIQ